MQFAHEIMDRDFLRVPVDMAVGELAALLLKHNADGACVVDGERLIGVVTTMDLVFQEKQVHLPSFITLMEMVIPLGGERARKELEKVTGGTVAEIMSKDPGTVAWDAPLSDVATLMVEKHYTLVPVLKGDHLQGVIGKRDLLKAAYAARGLA